jgi:hypothetical protein
MKEVVIISKEAEENRRTEETKLDNITKITTLSLMQGCDNKKETMITKTDLDELKLTVKEINQRVIEYGIYQDDFKGKELEGKEVKVRKEKKREGTPIKLQKYKPKRPPSESSSSSTSSDEGEGDKDIILKDRLKARTLIRSNLTTNDLDLEYIKKALMETENGDQFQELLEEKGYEFTMVHKMETRQGNEDIYEILKEYGCLPVPNGMQCPYCKWNYYGGSRRRTKDKLTKHMETTHLIGSNNHVLNILFNIYGTDWWMDLFMITK